MIKTLKYNYPWMKWYQVRDARTVFPRYVGKAVKITKKKDRIIVELRQSPDEREYYFRVRFNDKNYRYARGCRVAYKYPGGWDYVFKTRNPRCVIYIR